MTDTHLKILSPWAIYIKKMEALFDGDPQITCNVDYTGLNPYIVLSCDNGDKVAALLMLLPKEVHFGNVTLMVDVDGIPSNRAFHDKKELFEVAFDKNPAFAYAVVPPTAEYGWFDMVYVVFKNYVVQFFADNLHDCHGVISCLYEELATELLTGPGAQGVYFNTDVERAGVGLSTDQWP